MNELVTVTIARSIERPHFHLTTCIAAIMDKRSATINNPADTHIFMSTDVVVLHISSSFKLISFRPTRSRGPEHFNIYQINVA